MTGYCIQPHCGPMCCGCNGAITEVEAAAVRRARDAGQVSPLPGAGYDEATQALERLTRLGYMQREGDAWRLTVKGWSMLSSLADAPADCSEPPEDRMANDACTLHLAAFAANDERHELECPDLLQALEAPLRRLIEADARSLERRATAMVNALVTAQRWLIGRYGQRAPLVLETLLLRLKERAVALGACPQICGLVEQFHQNAAAYAQEQGVEVARGCAAIPTTFPQTAGPVDREG